MNEDLKIRFKIMSEQKVNVSRTEMSVIEQQQKLSNKTTATREHTI